MNIFNIRRAFHDKKIRKWDKLYWAIDLHDTVITGKYNKYNSGYKIYPGVQEVFQWFQRRPDMVPILWTSSHKDAINQILLELKGEGIEFKYINENPECLNTELCNFSNKFYFNILLDDKCGLCATTDWIRIKNELIHIGEWTNNNVVM